MQTHHRTHDVVMTIDNAILSDVEQVVVENKDQQGQTILVASARRGFTTDSGNASSTRLSAHSPMPIRQESSPMLLRVGFFSRAKVER